MRITHYAREMTIGNGRDGNGRKMDGIEPAQLLGFDANESENYAIKLSNWAKKELLREKVKKRMEQKYGKELNRMADLIVEMIEDEGKTTDSFGDQLITGDLGGNEYA
jgi:hypothetical protein